MTLEVGSFRRSLHRGALTLCGNVEEKLIDGIVLYLINLANIKVANSDGSAKAAQHFMREESPQFLVRKIYMPARKSSEQPSYRIVINDTVYLHNVLLPFFF